jgi:hypothetical protein
MSRALKVLLGLCLLAAVVFGSIQVLEHYEDEGRSPYEKLEEELEDEEGGTSTTSQQSMPVDSERYRQGDPDCRARQAPGTVGAVGEDVASGAVSERAFIACFGQPVRRTEVAGRDCFYYRQRGAQTYWRFCVRDGRIVSAVGSLPRPE